MDKKIIIDWTNKQVEIIITKEQIPFPADLKILIQNFNLIKKQLLKHLGDSFTIIPKLIYNKKYPPKDKCILVIKTVLSTLSKEEKRRLLAKEQNLNFKTNKLTFRIDEMFLATLIRTKKYIEETCEILGAPITVAWFHDTDIKAREQIEEINKKLVKEGFRSKQLAEYKKKRKPSPKKPYQERKGQLVANLQKLKDYPSKTLVVVQAKIITINIKKQYIIYIEDTTGNAKVITYNEAQRQKASKFKKGDIVYVEGSLKHDKENNETIIWFRNMMKVDLSKENQFNNIENEGIIKKEQPRFELHCHTKMSAYDGVSSIVDYYDILKQLGHEGMAITDHDCVQAFTEVAKIQAKDKKFKFIFGTEFTTLENNLKKLPCSGIPLNDCDYIIFDLETTGLYAGFDSILEVSLKKIPRENNILHQQGEELHFFIKPTTRPNSDTLEFTGITMADLNDGISSVNAAKRIKTFIESVKTPVLVAHNAFFDYLFLHKLFLSSGYEFPKVDIIDTLSVSKLFLLNKKSYALGKVASALKIQYDTKHAHRADYDVNVLELIWKKLWNMAIEQDIVTTNQLMNKVRQNMENWDYRHIIVLCKNEQGKKDLYDLMTLANTKYLGIGPRLPFEEIAKKRENLLLGSACWNGHVFRNALENNEQALNYWIKQMDYIEIQPLEVYSHLLSNSNMTLNNLKEVILRIIRAAKKANKIIVATSDAHYSITKDKIIRDIFINTERLKGARHEFYRTLATKINPNFVVKGPNQVYRTTKNMLESFSFLKDEINIEDLVITNTFKIANECENYEIKPKGLFSPSIENIDLNKWITSTTNKKAYELYKGKVPLFVTNRINKELEILIKNNFAIIYYMSESLVDKILKKDALVGSRGSVGSSLVAFLLGITEVNPLEPHYFCEACGHSEISQNDFISAFDLEDKKCSKCTSNEFMKKYGTAIPFETFLGLKGDKVPDIDLNLPSELQHWSHQFIKTLMGEENVVRAGTTLTVANKTAFAIYMKYNELLSPNDKLGNKDYIIGKMVGVKRTTGRHAGGIIIAPLDKGITYFTPLQYPSHKKTEQKTTHFDFNFLHDNLLKLDLLGHGDPSMVGQLMKTTGVHVNDINYSDKNLVKLFNDCRVMGITPQSIGGERTGSIALPEFGTKLTRQITKAVKPQSFADLVRISGISHGDGVWKGNIEELVKKNVPIKDLVTCRDDIMIYLSNHKIPLEICFSIMERTRKGIKLSSEENNIMKHHQVPDQFINTCSKIKYLFPKAHAVAYVLMAYRCAYYKLHHMIEFYCAHFTWKAKRFPYHVSQYSQEKMLEEYKKRINTKTKLTDLDEKELVDLEIILEMKARGINILLPDLNVAHDKEYIAINDKRAMMIPISALDGFGKIAETIVEERKHGLFKSYADLRSRVKLNIAQDKELKNLNLTNFALTYNKGD